MVALDRTPKVEFANDPRFEFVPFKAGPTAGLSEAHIDQARKLNAMASLVAERGGGYFMPVDMDDFVSRDLVAYVACQPTSQRICNAEWIWLGRAHQRCCCDL
jgi:hypothetical protein